MRVLWYYSHEVQSNGQELPFPVYLASITSLLFSLPSRRTQISFAPLATAAEDGEEGMSSCLQNLTLCRVPRNQSPCSDTFQGIAISRPWCRIADPPHSCFFEFIVSNLRVTRTPLIATGRTLTPHSSRPGSVSRFVGLLIERLDDTGNKTLQESLVIPAGGSDIGRMQIREAVADCFVLIPQKVLGFLPPSLRQVLPV